MNQFELSKLVLKNLSQFDLSPTAKLVLIALIGYYNPKTNEIFPKQITIAEQLGISLSSVKRSVKELSAHQLVIYELKNTNRYKFTSTLFNLIKLTPEIAQNESSSCVKMTPPCHEQKNKKINNNYYNNQAKKEVSSASFEHKTKDQLYEM